MTEHKIQVGVLIFPGADILDFTGPTEIFSGVGYQSRRRFGVTTIGVHDTIIVGDGLSINPTRTIEQARKQLDEYDVLVVPGGPLDTMMKLTESDGVEEIELIKEFSKTAPKQGAKRVLQSVCSGSFLLGAAGILEGREATTHHLGLELLKQVCDKANGGRSKVRISHKRWVDGGYNENGVKIVTAGGVTSGLDTSLYIVEEFVGKDLAQEVADLVEYVRWNNAG